jgi:hypothetical protein
MRIGGQPRHHDSKKQVPRASSENYGANATRVGWVPQSGLVQSRFYALSGCPATVLRLLAGEAAALVRFSAFEVLLLCRKIGLRYVKA